MATAKQLLEKRADLVAESRKILEKANSEDRTMTTEERTQWEKMHADIDDLKVRADDLHAQEVAGRIPDDELFKQVEGEARTIEGSGPKTKESAISDAEFFRAWALGPRRASDDVRKRCQAAGLSLSEGQIDFRIARPDGWTPPRSVAEAKRRRDALYEKRAQTGLQTTTTAGGYTVPDEMMMEIDTALLAYGGMRQVSTIITTATGADLPIPTSNDTGNVGEIIGENTTHNDQDVAFGQVVLNAFKYSSKFIKCSIEFLQDTSINAPAWLGARAGERVGRIQNTHFTTGDGSGKPLGITGSGAAFDAAVDQAVAGTLEWDTEMLALKHSVDPAYRANATWMMTDNTLLEAKKMQDSTGRPLWLPGLVGGAADTFDGDPIVVNQDIPNALDNDPFILYGDFSKYIIRDTLGMTILRLDERFAELGQVAFLVFARADGDLIDAGTHPVKYAEKKV